MKAKNLSKNWSAPWSRLPRPLTPSHPWLHVWLRLMHAPDEAWYNVSQGSSFFGLLQGSSLPRWHDVCQEINSKLCATSKNVIVALRAEPKLILESLCNLATNTPLIFLLDETHESVNNKFNNAGLQPDRPHRVLTTSYNYLGGSEPFSNPVQCWSSISAIISMKLISAVL